MNKIKVKWLPFQIKVEEAVLLVLFYYEKYPASKWKGLRKPPSLGTCDIPVYITMWTDGKMIESKRHSFNPVKAWRQKYI